MIASLAYARQRAVLPLLCLVAAVAHGEPVSKRIAFTFDDAPRPAGAYMDLETRTDLLVRALASAEIPGAMFFATTANLERRGDEGLQRLKVYADAGHAIANHSHSHQSANRLSAADFLTDIDTATRRLKALPGYLPYFRFPFLHEGDTASKRDAIRDGLKARGLRQGYVTVDNYDWYLQALFEEAVLSTRPVDLNRWRDLYVDVLVSAVSFYNNIALKTVKHRVAHVLLLHENDLAALFVDDLARALREDGWDIVSAADAFTDPIAEREPDTLLLNQGRVVALAATEGLERRTLFHPLESESALRALAVQRGLVEPLKQAYLGQTPPGMTPQRFAVGTVSLPDQYEYGSVFSADGQTLYFGVALKNRAEIRRMRHTDGGWSAPETVLSHPAFSYADPYLSRDETRLYFISDQPISGTTKSPTHDLWYIQRQRGGWSDPIRLDAPINTAAEEFYTSFADDGTLAFASNVAATRRGDFDIYLSRVQNGAFLPPEKLPANVSSTLYEADPFISPDGRYLIFSSNRPPRQGKRDLWVTFALADGDWSEPISLGPKINTPALELCPFVTRDGRYLFYTSDEDIYWVDAGVIELARERVQSH